MTPAQQISVWAMRILCPLASLSALVLAVLAWRQGLYLEAFLDAVLFGVNAALTDINWRRST